MNNLDEAILIASLPLRNAQPIQSINPTFLPIHLTGGIGDVICSIDSIVRLSQDFNVIVYTKHIETFKYFCKADINVHKELPIFNWHLEFNTVARFRFQETFSGFLIDSHKKLFEKQLELFRLNPMLRELVHQHPKKDFILADYAEHLKLDRRSFPLHTLGYSRLPYERDYRSVPSGYITLHNGMDISNWGSLDGYATKQYRYWEEVVLMIKEEYPDYPIVQLGKSETSQYISGAENWLDKTNLIGAFEKIANSLLHLDICSGLAHAAAKMSVPSIVLFGPTPAKFYGYEWNTNITNQKTCIGGCYWLKDDWTYHCPVGYSRCKAMDDIRPETVFEAVKARLG